MIGKCLLFVAVYALMCASYYAVVFTYEIGWPFLVTVIMLVMSLAVSITISILAGGL